MNSDGLRITLEFQFCPCQCSPALAYLQNGAMVFNSEGHSVAEVHGALPVTQVFSARKFSPPSAFIKRVTNVANDIVTC